MGDIMAWLSSTTGVITTVVAFMAAILLLIENSKKLVFRPLSKLKDILFGWINKSDHERMAKLEEQFNTFLEKSNAVHQEIVDSVGTLGDKIDANECDRIRSEIFNYGRIARTHHVISVEEWRHIQDIYYKYHDTLHGNGQVTEEYDFIKEYYYAQFEAKTEEE